MKPTQNYLQLELHVDDFGLVKDYYGKLEFNTVWERQPEGNKGYLVLENNGNVLCFWCGTEDIYDQEYFKQFPRNTPRGFGVEVVLMVEDIEEFYRRVQDFANIVEPLIEQPWGLKDFRCVDPYGYYLRFTSKHDILDPANAVE